MKNWWLIKLVKQKVMEKSLFMSVLLIILAFLLMVLFIISQAHPIFDYGFLKFIFGFYWIPQLNKYGIFPMIVSSVYVTVIALLISIPVAVSTAIYLEEFASQKVKLLFHPVIQTLSGIPSVVYGFFGLEVLIPLFRTIFGGSGFSIMVAGIVLAIMVLPTIISLTKDAIKAVPLDLRESSMALGSTHFQAIKNIVIPQAIPGILSAVTLAMARAIGETLAVLMVVGNVSQFPDSLFDPVRTLTSNIALEMGYAVDIHYSALFATAIVLIMLIMIMLIISNYIKYKIMEE